MDTKDKLIIAFNATDAQKEMLKSFCKDKTSGECIIAISQSLSDHYMLYFSALKRKPEIYFGVFSLDTKSIVENVALSDAEIILALEGLELKYAHAMTRKNPVADKYVVTAWADYINTHTPTNVILL